MIGWKEIKLGEIAKVISGFAFKSADFKKDNGIPVIKIKNIKGGEIDLTDCDYVNDKYLSINQRYHLKRNDILVSLTGSHITQPNSVVGRIALYRHNITSLLNQRAGKILPDISLVDKLFLYSYLSQDSVKESIALKARGAANQANISPGDVEDTNILLPPLLTQHRIASILSAYDDLIENNTKRIKILEELAQRAYVELFVKFRVNGEQLEVNEETGMPEGWLKGKVKDLCVLQRGFDLPSQKRQTGCFPIIASTGKIDTHNEFKVKAPGVVTGRSGTIGQVTYVDVDFWPLNTSLWVKEYFNCGPCFVYFFLKSLNLEKLKSGVAVPSLDRNVVHTQSCIIPSAQTLNLYEQFAKPIFYNISNLVKQNRLLKESRDMLLPRLMSGVINVDGDTSTSLSVQGKY